MMDKVSVTSFPDQTIGHDQINGMIRLFGLNQSSTSHIKRSLEKSEDLKGLCISAEKLTLHLTCE